MKTNRDHQQSGQDADFCPRKKRNASPPLRSFSPLRSPRLSQPLRSLRLLWSGRGVTAIVIALVLMAGCRKKAELLSPEGELRIYTWHNYTPAELIERFEMHTGISVTIDTFDGNQDLLDALRKGEKSYDIVVPTHNFMEVLIGEALLQKVNVDSLPNYEQIGAKWRTMAWDPDAQYTIPYAIGSTSFAYRETAVQQQLPQSYSAFFTPNEEICGELMTFTDPEEIFAMAHTYLGQDGCSEDAKEITAVEELLLKQSQCVKAYDSETHNQALANRQVKMAATWDGDVYQGITKYGMTDLNYVFPQEGLLTWMDVMAVPANAKNVNAARYFMNYLLRPNISAIITNSGGYITAVDQSKKFLTPSALKTPFLNVPQGQALIFSQSCAAEVIEKQTIFYEDLKARHQKRSSVGSLQKDK